MKLAVECNTVITPNACVREINRKKLVCLYSVFNTSMPGEEITECLKKKIHTGEKMKSLISCDEVYS